MHILIEAVGSAGDVYPFIAVGQALVRRGHAVTLIATPPHQQRIERAGLQFFAGCSQAQLDELIADSDLWHPRKGFAAIWRRLGKMLPAAYAEQLPLVRPGQTVLVASTLALGARLLQETHGLSLATVHLAPSCFFSALDPAVRAGLGWLRALPPWAARAVLNFIERSYLDPMIRADLDSLRTSLGLAPVRRIMSHWLHSPQRVICAFPDWFSAPQTDWPANTVCTAFPRLAAGPGEVIDDALQRFLDAGPAPLAFSPGSAMAHGRAFFDRAIAASAALGMRAVLVTPYRDQLPASLPSHVHHAAYVAFDLLAPRVAGFAHHGGIGTCATVLAAGTPQLIVPFAFDQHDNAARLQRLGVARTVGVGAPAGLWVEALSGLLRQPSVRLACAAYAARIAAETPASDQIADQIEMLGLGPSFPSTRS